METVSCHLCATWCTTAHITSQQQCWRNNSAKLWESRNVLMEGEGMLSNSHSSFPHIPCSPPAAPEAALALCWPSSQPCFRLECFHTGTRGRIKTWNSWQGKHSYSMAFICSLHSLMGSVPQHRNTDQLFLEKTKSSCNCLCVCQSSLGNAEPMDQH